MRDVARIPCTSSRQREAAVGNSVGLDWQDKVCEIKLTKMAQFDDWLAKFMEGVALFVVACVSVFWWIVVDLVVASNMHSDTLARLEASRPRPRATLPRKPTVTVKVEKRTLLSPSVCSRRPTLLTAIPTLKRKNGTLSQFLIIVVPHHVKQIQLLLCSTWTVRGILGVGPSLHSISSLL